MSPNTLLNAKIILSTAMAIVRDQTPVDIAPFRITVTLEFMSQDLTRTIDDFTNTFLIPALAEAIRRPDDGLSLIEPGGVDWYYTRQLDFPYDEEDTSPRRIIGHLVRSYDIHTDLFSTVIEIIVGRPEALV